MEDFKAYINAVSQVEDIALNELLACFKTIQLKKNDFFVKDGEYAKQIGFLNKGIVRAFFLNNAGKEYTKQFFTSPTIIGAYTSLLTKKPNRIPQQALTDCEVIVADYRKIEALFNKHHSLERLGRKIAEFYFLEKEQKELEMALLDADKRYLLFREQFPSIEAIIPQYYVASYLGISPTQLSRIRKKLY